MDILLTGASGFLGSILKTELSDFKIISLGRSKENEIVTDITKEIIRLPKVNIVIHAAGKAHSVPSTDLEKQAFFDVNFTGTQNLLKGLEHSLPKSFVFISTVSVYGKTTGSLIKEDSPLSETSAYGRSKIQAEFAVRQWCAKNGVICTILRLPLIIGFNPIGNLKSMVIGIEKGYYFNISQNKAKKSMVLARDVANIIPKAATIGGIYNLTDGYHPSFHELSIVIAQQLNKKKPYCIPFILAKLIAYLGDNLGSKMPLTSSKLSKITSTLTFSDDKARMYLNWSPGLVIKHPRIFE